MILMGIDPGLASTGVGVIKALDDGGYRIIHSEFVLTNRLTPLPQRLEKIHDLVRGTIDRHHPAVVAVESVFFAKNVRSAVLMAHGRGAAILAVSQSGVPLREYSPLEIKQSVVGKGRATKEQVQRMVGILLSLGTIPESDHETDALACALCHAFRSAASERMRPSATAETSDLQNLNKQLLAQMRTSRRRGRR